MRTKFPPPQLFVTKESGFAFSASPDQDVNLGDSPDVGVALQQHLRIRSDRFFGGTGRISLDSHLQSTGGLRGQLVLPMQLRRDETAEDLKSTFAPDGPSAHGELKLMVRASPLADPVPLIACQEVMFNES